MTALRLIPASIVLAIALIGCAATPTGPIPLSSTVIAKHEGRVGVIMSELPKANTSFPGASCLLCLAAASVANSSLTTHAHTLSTEEVASYRANLIEALRKKGFEVSDLPGSLDVSKLPDAHDKDPMHAKKNFSSLKAKYAVDRLCVLEVAQVGFERPYAAYIPTGAPQAVIRGKAYMVDLASNTYDWYEPIEVSTPAEGAWDEPPAFPGLTNAYFQAIEKARDLYVGPFKN